MSKLLSASTNSITRLLTGDIGIIIVHVGSSSILGLRWRIAPPRFLLFGCGGLPGRKLLGLGYTSWLLTWDLLGAKVLDELLVDLLEVALPDHNDRVLATSGEVVTTWRESSRGGGSLMAIEGVQDVALSKIPDLQGTVVAAREQVSTIGVEIDFVDLSRVGIVMLDES